MPDALSSQATFRGTEVYVEMRGAVLPGMMSGAQQSAPINRHVWSGIWKKMGPPESPKYSPFWLPVVTLILPLAASESIMADVKRLTPKPSLAPVCTAD